MDLDCGLLSKMDFKAKIQANLLLLNWAPRIICKLIGKLSELGLRLAAGIDIKGGTDSLFFIEDPSFRKTGRDAIQYCREFDVRTHNHMT